MAKKNTNLHVILILVSFMFSCSHKHNLGEPKEYEIMSTKSNKCFCFENGYYEDNSDSIIESYKYNVFSKKKNINDSLYSWSIHSKNSKYMIDTFACNKAVNYQLLWQNKDFICFIAGCGSYCWSNLILPTYQQKTPILLQYSTLDTSNMNALSIVNNNFIITNLYTQKENIIPIKNINLIDGYPLFYFQDIELNKKSIQYKIRLKNNSLIDNSIQF